MRLATATYAGRPVSGVVRGEALHPLPTGSTVLDLVRLGLPAALEIGRRAVAQAEPLRLAELQLLPPLVPPSIRDFVAFEEHVEGVVRSVSQGSAVQPEWYEAPAFYFSNPHALVGAYDDVPVPAGCELLDYELEVAAVVGVDGRDITADDAEESIFGYTVFNDWSARDLQRREMRVGLGPAKGKDFATTLGPWLVTADELTAYRDADGFLALQMCVAVDGVEIGRDLLSNMGWRFADLLAYASRDSWVRAGDVLGSGTCGNGGCLAELWGVRGRQDPPPLRPGNVVTMTVEGLGTIRNQVVAGPADAPLTPATPRSRRRQR